MKISSIGIRVFFLIIFLPMLLYPKYYFSSWSYKAESNSATFASKYLNVQYLGDNHKLTTSESGEVPKGIFKRVAILPMKTSMLNNSVIDTNYNRFISKIESNNRNVTFLKNYRENYKMLSEKKLDRYYEVLSYVNCCQQYPEITDKFSKIFKELNVDCILFIDYNSFNYIIPPPPKTNFSIDIKKVKLISDIYIRVLGINSNILINYTKNFSFENEYLGFEDTKFNELKEKFFENHLQLLFDIIINDYEEQIF
jgi:hypothetical protein